MLKKKWFWILLIIILAVVAYAIFGGKKPMPPQTVTAKRGNISQKVIASGEIIPRHAIQVRSQIFGTVGKILVPDGSYVQKGEKLVIIDPNPTPENYADLLSKLHTAKAQFLQAKKTFERNQRLVKMGAIAKQDFDTSRESYLVAQSALNLAQQNYDLNYLGKTSISGKKVENVITSPITGSLLHRFVDQGDQVIPLTQAQAGTPLFTIANMHDLIFKGEVSQVDVGKLKNTMPAMVQIAALPGLALKGKISKIDLQSNSDSATDTTDLFPLNTNITDGYVLQIDGFKLPKGQQLRAGYQATAMITVKTAKDVVTLAEQAIQYEAGKPYVLLPNGQNPPKHQPVKLGIADNMNVQVLSGLQAGQKVLLPQVKDSE